MVLSLCVWLVGDAGRLAKGLFLSILCDYPFSLTSIHRSHSDYAQYDAYYKLISVV